MDQETFNDWLEHPGTEYVRKYLIDSANEEAQLLADTIVGGGLVSELTQTRIATTCITLNRIAEIDLEEIANFYTE